MAKVLRRPSASSATPQQARQASKEGVVRYVLVISTVSVVILFAVAYTLLV